MSYQNEINETEEIADRLIAERVRLGYSKADFAREINVQRQTLRTYETGASNIPSNILVNMGRLGVDVLFVLFNQRNLEIAEQIAEKFRMKGEKIAEQILNASERGSSSLTNNATLTNSVIAGNGSTVNNIHTTNHTTKTIAEIKPGIEHITDEQAGLLKNLVDDIVVIESTVKQKNPRSHRAVWAALNKYCKVPSYRLIKFQDFEKAEKYLRSKIGQLTSMKTAPKKMPDWRNKRYRYIHASFQEYPELEKWFSDYIQQKFQTTSKTELTDTDLQSAYEALSNKKSRMRRAG